MSAEKLALKDEFAQYNQVFAAAFAHVQVDVCLEHGSIIDTGSHQLEVIYTPGHCSGAICLYEHRTRAMFTADVIMANGVVGGVVATGNIRDFIGSFRRLPPWHIDLLLPGHGATSTEALRCIDIGIARLETLLRETREVFSAMTGADHGYASIIRSLEGLNAASRPDADAG
jgi:glyoxylase-like metal-dependent hydrolase (beta-lactamase superfamily II)